MKSLDFGRGTSLNHSCLRASSTVILYRKKIPTDSKIKKKLSRCILDEHTCNWFHIYFITLSGSYVRSLFSKSKPASDRVGEPVNEVAGNFLRNRLYLKEQASGKKHDITTMQSRKNKRNH